MSVTTTTTRIAAMWRNVEGITKAFTDIPRVLLPVELPAVVIFPGAATYDTDAEGDNDVLETRVYQMNLYVEKAAFGTENQAQIKVNPFFDRVRDYFLARPGLELDDATLPQDVVYTARITGDSGFQIFEYPPGGDQYAAISFTLQVQEWAAVAYQD